MAALWIEARHVVDTASRDDHVPVDRNLAAFLSALRRPDWMRYAACRGQDVDMWFPGRGDNHKPAVNICRTCPAANACLDYAVAHDDGRPAGIYGGATPNERRQLQRDAA